jgi:hypothetical protein
VYAPTAVSAWGGHVVWSAYDPAAGVYRLTDRSAAGVRVLPVAARPVPFDADVGPDARGRPTVVYSRCRVEGVPFVRPGWYGTFRNGSGCDVFMFGLGGGGGERRPKGGVDTARESETTPSIWRGRIAFARRAERGGLRRHVPRLYVQARSGRPRLIHAIGGMIPCDPRHPAATQCPRVEATSLATDLSSRYLAFGWRVRGSSTYGVGDITEIRLTRIGSDSSTLLASKDEGGAASDECSPTPLWPSIGRATVSWLESSGADACRFPVAGILRRGLARPRFQRAALPGPYLSLAFDGPAAFALQPRGTRPDASVSNEVPQSCNEPQRSCELVTLTQPPFASIAARENIPEAMCWTLDLRRAGHCG